MRRIVVEYATGPYAGIRQIQGTTAGVVEPLVKQFNSIQLTTHIAPVELVRDAPRYVLYREIIQKESHVPDL